MRSLAVALAAIVLLPVVASMPSLVRTLAPGAGPFNGLQVTLADFRGDGQLEVVVQSDDSNVYILDPRTGATMARFAPGNAGCTTTCYQFEGVSGPINAPIVTDTDKDGRLDVIVADTAAVVARYEVDDVHSDAQHLVFIKKWEHRYNNYQSFTTMDASPIVADLNGDGSLDIVIATEETGVFAVRSDGSTMWAQALPSGHATPTIADLDGDGHPEVVLANDDGKVYALNGATGATKWTFNAQAYVWPASIPAQPTVADITGDGRPDILFGARDAHDSTTFANDHAVLFAIDASGHLLWKAQPGWAAPLSHTRPVVVSSGGAKSVVWGDWNTIGHKPGNFEKVGPGHVAAFDASGHETWHADLNAAVSDKDVLVADVLGDGVQEVVAAGTNGGQTGVWLFDLGSGASRGFLATPAPTRSFAAVADLLGDGSADLALADDGGQVQIFSGPKGAAAAFPGWGAVKIAHETVPLTGGGTTPPPPPPPPPPNGTSTFAATFGPKGNEWWVETSVSSSHATASVTASVSGGAPVALPKTSWGTWAKSIHAVSGSVVLLTATDAAGATASACYHWVTFTAADCGGGTTTTPPPPPPPPPPSGTFSATFAPRNGNEWWIQVHVTSSEPITGVDVQIAGGAWQPLKLQSWGDWAASYHAPAGSQVVFRASNGGGEYAMSDAYTWPQ